MSDFQFNENIDFKALLQAAPDAVVVHDLNDCVLFWNQAAEELYGWNAADILGRPVTRIFYLDRKEREEAMAVLSNGGVWERELRQLDCDNDEYLVQVRQYMQLDALGKPVAIVSFNTNITAMRKLADAQERAKHVKSSSILAGGVAHELNNALAPIMLSSAMLKRSVEDEKSQNMVSMIERCATKGAKLIADLLAFERGTPGGSDMMQSTQISRSIQRVQKEIVPQNVELELKIAEDLWGVRGKLSEMDRIFRYVIENACEAMLDGGKLGIEVENRFIDATFEGLAPEAKAGAYVSFIFTDSGIGIAPNVLERVAEPFFTTKVPKQNFGFGLSNTQAIVKGHGGFMVIESQPSEGTTLRLFLPADSDSVVIPDEVEFSQNHKTGTGELVLVVDDEIFVRETIKRTLEDSGYQVVLAQDGTEALAIYASRMAEVDLVLTNVEMPYLDGPALCRALQKLNPEVKILVSSGHRELERAQAVRSCGAASFLAKPYCSSDLLGRVQALLGR
jgi:PAS domain S-box-containing protein